MKSSLGKQYLVALNLAPATPGWLRALNAAPMYLGLDLRGGVHFLMEVDMAAAIRRLEESLLSDIRSHLRSEKIRYRGDHRTAGGGDKNGWQESAGYHLLRLYGAGDE